MDSKKAPVKHKNIRGAAYYKVSAKRTASSIPAAWMS
jgi:hypothetical protein